jgi:AraC-like DNA-binding protein
MTIADDIHLIRASQAQPFVATARRKGAPVSRLARRAGLPLAEVNRGKGVIGEHSLWEFVALLSQLPGFEVFGYQVALDHPVTETRQLGEMEIQPGNTLEDLLEAFFSDIAKQSDGTAYSIDREGGSYWYVRKPFLKGHIAGWQAELYVVAFMIQIIRLYAPGDWLPEELQLYAREETDRIPQEWQGIRLVTAQETRIKLSRELLQLRAPPPRITTEPSAEPQTSLASILHISDLIDRQIWGQSIGFDKAAMELGMSGTTLKRRLRAQGHGYSKLLQERRMHHAGRLLSTSNLSVSEIARAMGYSKVSNFSRAFTRVNGISPSQYRDG